MLTPLKFARLCWGYLARPAVISGLVLGSAGLGAETAKPLPESLRQQVDEVARTVLRETHVPGLSLAIVQDGRIAYVHAYGNARLEPKLPTTPAMRFNIGSVTKQFTAAAMLLLEGDGKLSLDDPVAKYVPSVTRARDMTIRQLLTHTSGLEDYFPQSYLLPFMREPTTPEQIVARWGRRPLTHEPGTQWEYSTTGYIVAGMIVEQVSGLPWREFLQRRLFEPLEMKSVTSIEANARDSTGPLGYRHYALGPLRPSPATADGWYGAGGGLAMTAEDLARWNLALIRQTPLPRKLYAELTREVILPNGTSSHYGLGLAVHDVGGHRALEHSGQTRGFAAENLVFPEDRFAVTVLVNDENAAAPGAAANRIASLFLAFREPSAVADFASATGAWWKRVWSSEPPTLQSARVMLASLQRGAPDTARLTEDARDFFTAEVLQDYTDSLAPLGDLQSVIFVGSQARGSYIQARYTAKFARRTVSLATLETPDGRFEEFQVFPLQ